MIVTSKVASVDAFDSKTPASAASVMPNDADTSLTCQVSAVGRLVKLLATDSAPADIAALMSDRRLRSSSLTLVFQPISSRRNLHDRNEDDISHVIAHFTTPT